MCPICYLLSIGLIVMTRLKPDFYWKSEQVSRVRSWFGERGASIFYYSIGGFILTLGIIALTW